MREKYLYDRQMFKMSAQGIFCGVFMPTRVMEKILKIETMAMAEIRKIMYEYEDELLPQSWTLANEKDGNGKILKQVTIDYTTNDRDDIKRRIALFEPSQPTPTSVYSVPCREIAEEIAGEILQEELRVCVSNG